MTWSRQERHKAHNPETGLRSGEEINRNRERRCGPWVTDADGRSVCQKCGDVEYFGQLPFPPGLFD